MRSSLFLRFALLTGAFTLAACGGSPKSSSPSADTGCTGCHGDPTRGGTALAQAAPPVDAHGGSATTLVTVGAHQKHLQSGVACSTCHTVPAPGDLTHIDGPYARVQFSGPVVGADNALVSTWDRGTATCANYCHGATYPIGAVKTPSWTRQTPLGCDACHSPQDTIASASGLHYFHVVNQQVACSGCHGDGYSATAGVTGAALATHVDGQVQLAPAVGWQDQVVCGTAPRLCNGACHNPKPPACYYWP